MLFGLCQGSSHVESPIICENEPFLGRLASIALKIYSSSHKQALSVPQIKSVANQSPISPSARPTPIEPALGLSCHLPEISSGKHWQTPSSQNRKASVDVRVISSPCMPLVSAYEIATGISRDWILSIQSKGLANLSSSTWVVLMSNTEMISLTTAAEDRSKNWRGTSTTLPEASSTGLIALTIFLNFVTDGSCASNTLSKI